MRGVVSLAAALSIPVHLADGTAFPQRNLILFITFIVILLTLLLQGLTLPYLIKKMDLPDFDQSVSDEEIDSQIRKQLADHALHHLNTSYSEQLKNEPFLRRLVRKLEDQEQANDEMALVDEARTIYLDIIDKQRQWLIHKNNEDEAMNEEIIRKHLKILDLEEERLIFL